MIFGTGLKSLIGAALLSAAAFASAAQDCGGPEAPCDVETGSYHLALPDPELTGEVTLADGQLMTSLKARGLARLVEVKFEGADTVLSDNYFDLPAGREARVDTTLPLGWTLEQARGALRTRSIYDSFAHAGKAG